MQDSTRGYYYDTESGLYYLQSRYYDPAIGRFINADNYSSTGQGIIGHNMFAYCGNNPVLRKDSEGTMWFVTFGVGLATQYLGDIIGNLLDGKTGLDVFTPTSSVGEYIAAGVTALIPGTGLGGALIRNVVAEGITLAEDAFSGKEINLVESAFNVGIGTVLDAGFEKIADKAVDFISSKAPRNYSSHANKVRKKKPELTREQVYRSMQRSIRTNRAVSKAVSFGIDVARTCLPY